MPAKVFFEHDQERAPDSFHPEFYEDMRLSAMPDGMEKMRGYPLIFQTDQLSRRFAMQNECQWHALNCGGLVVLVEGLIGVGKSTFCEELGLYLPDGFGVLDRSFYGDTCFARMLAKSGHITEKQFKSYTRLYKTMTYFVPLPNVLVRLLIHPEFAAERIKKRAEERAKTRGDEVTTVGVEYLRALDTEITFMSRGVIGQGVNVIEISWDADRDTPEQRERTVRGVADRIVNYKPLDLFLDLHRRTT